jgi:hypothetical protein
LCDISNYVLAFESLLERMWVQHCTGSGERLLPVKLV